MTTKKTSEAQLRATKKYQAKMDQTKKRYQSYKGTSKTFIRKHANLEDLIELEQLIAQRKQELK